MKYEVCSVSELETSPMIKKVVEGKELLVVKLEEEIKVLSAVCPHRGAPLIDGDVVEGLIICPWHRSVFRCGDGKCIHGPSRAELQSYQTILKDNIVYVSYS